MKKLLTALLAIGLALCLMGCDPGEGGWVGPHAPEPSKPHTLRHTGIVADSLIDCCDELWVASPYVQEAPMKMWTIGATNIPGAATWIAQTAPQVDIFIIAQGTNNARNGWDATDIAGYNQYLDSLDSVPCLVLVNLGYSGVAATDYKNGANSANSWINTAAADPAPGQMRRVANWRGWSSYAPQWFGTDGIHHTPGGNQKYMDIIQQAARGCPKVWG